MKNLLFPLLFLGLFCSCNEEIGREISTDLSEEVRQFYTLSTALTEGSYLANFTYGDYFRLQSESLPGCPKIEIDQSLRLITLDYDSVDSCMQERNFSRKGKIRIDYSLSNTQISTWWMEYEDYHFDKSRIQGTRQFQSLSPNQNQESFENLRLITDTNLSFTAKGSHTYFISRFSSRPFAISFVGTIEGINPVGRRFKQTLSGAKEVFINCYSEGWILPFEGEETWTVERGATRELSYKIAFSSEEECNPLVNATLPDGRILILNP
ncbi:hypothetical protein [Algoriphagus confluentis]|uniref:Lipoprotein n=1 Tax=Algoriphagus confluentis TaxID=1697556 RepID=A0ABQ6PR73_9BACT|nr:hypothetical protein Aconfl_31570 [Algoriphagus confluentis]